MVDSEIKINTEEKREQRTEEVYRVTVTKKTDEAVTKIVDRVNDGFDGGHINRIQAVNWMLTKFAENVSEATIKEIRADHFDEIAVLESIFRKAKKTGVVPPELRGLIQRQVGVEDVPKKPKSRLTKNVTNGDIEAKDDLFEARGDQKNS